jgi:AraC-like DNA-binding protein
MLFKQNNLMNPAEKTAAELSVFYAGWQQCHAGHHIGYGVMAHYLMYYIVGGSGEYHIDGRIYKLSKGDGFIICPSACAFCRADPEDPWEYYWVGFSGPGAKMLLEAADLSVENLIFHYDRDDYIKDCLQSISKSTSTSASVEYEALGYFYLLMSRLVEQYKTTCRERLSASGHYVEKAIQYIQCSYWKNLTINEVAKYVGLDRSHLFRLFKMNTDFSPQQYLINYRIAKACELIAKTSLNYEEIAHSVGFEYPSYFFRLFKKQAGITPSEYRQNALGERAV